MIEQDRNKLPEKRVDKVTLAQIVGAQITEPSSLSLFNAPLTLISNRYGNISEYVVLIEHPLRDSAMYDFLRFTANNAFDPGISDVHGDWRLPDQKRNDFIGDYYINLQEMHKHLGESWAMFESHRKKFMKVIENGNPVPFQLPTNFITEAELDNGVMHLIQTREADNCPTFFEATSNFSRDELFELIRLTRKENYNITSESKKTSTKLMRRLFLRIHTLRKPTDIFINSPQWKCIRDYFKDKEFWKYNFPINDEESIQIFRRKTKLDIEGPKLLHSITDRGFQYSLTYDNGRMVYKRFIDPDSLNGLIPAIHWKTTRNEDESVQSRKLQTDIKIESLDMNGADSLLGLLAVAYFSPEIRSGWPKYLGLPGSKHQQGMGPGQIPVVAYMRREKLEKSPFLEQLEWYIEQNKR